MISYSELVKLWQQAAEYPMPNVGCARTQEDADWIREMYPEVDDDHSHHADDRS